jgi:predicted phosphodiesterase
MPIHRPIRHSRTFFALAICASVITAVVLGWTFTFHDTTGFYRANVPARIGFYVIALFGLLSAVASVISARSVKSLHQYRFAIPLWTVTAIGLILPLSLVSYILPYQFINAGDKPVRLLVLKSSPAVAVPDLALTWWTVEPSPTVIKWEYGNQGGDVSDPRNTQGHVFPIRNLPPDTLVRYQISPTETGQFRSPPGPGKPLRFAVGSDSHIGAGDARPDLTAKMLKQIAAPDNGYSLFLFGGDLVEHGFNDHQWQEALQAFSSHLSAIPAIYTAGNHDNILGGLKRFQQYLNAGNGLWWRTVVGGVHFFVLDREWNDDGVTAERRAWLEKELSLIPRDDWVVVISHACYYASGGVFYLYPWYDDRTSIRELAPVFEKYDVDLVLSGHNHQLELLRNNGVTYAICGGFGGIPNPPVTYVSPASVWFLGGNYGFLDVTVGAKMDLTFRDPDGKVLKSLTVER